MKWTVAGYYFDGNCSWTIFENDYGKTKMKKGVH